MPKLIKAADVTTQPVPKAVSNMPKCTKRRSSEAHTFQTVEKSARSSRNSARLTAYKPVDKSGPTSKKPENAPASTQKRSQASHSIKPPKIAMTAPWASPTCGTSMKSFQPRTNQIQARKGWTLRTRKGVLGKGLASFITQGLRGLNSAGTPAGVDRGKQGQNQ